MEYRIEFDGQEIELPSYNFDIESKMDSIERTIQFKEKCSKMFEFVKATIGNEATENLLGNSFSKVDPNVLQLIYSEIENAYRSPVVENNMKMMQRQMEQFDMGRFTEYMDKIATIEKMKNKRK